MQQQNTGHLHLRFFVHVFLAVGLELGNEWQMLLFIAPGLKIKSVGMSHVRVLQKEVYFKPQK